MRRFLVGLVTILLFSGLSFQAEALTIYDDRGLWEEATEILQVIDFDGYTQTGAQDETPDYSHGDGTIFSVADPASLYLIETLATDATYLTSGYLSWQASQEPNPIPLEIALAQETNSLSFDFGKGENPGLYIPQTEEFQFQIDINYGNSVVDTFTRLSTPNDYTFWGITTDEVFTSFSISANNIPIIDNFAYGNALVDDDDDVRAAPVPEPATVFLLGLGLLGLVKVKRKNNNIFN